MGSTVSLTKVTGKGERKAREAQDSTTSSDMVEATEIAVAMATVREASTRSSAKIETSLADKADLETKIQIGEERGSVTKARRTPTGEVVETTTNLVVALEETIAESSVMTAPTQARCLASMAMVVASARGHPTP